MHQGERGATPIMQTEIPPKPSTSASQLSWAQRKRISTADLMQGAREVIIVHEGEEYVLRITKTGKLILTK
jgi:hemin uptake protein HemP